jgi:hypothetical protein
VTPLNPLTALDNDEYCRQVEAYLCRKNDGHLIRLVGPAFERVRGWAAQGIPFKIVCQGIDRYFVRYYAKGPKRRPVQIDFCDADVLDAFDAWRRSVGVRLPGTEPTEQETVRKQRGSLPEHLNRVLERLTALLVSLEVSGNPFPESSGKGFPEPFFGGLRPLLESTANEIATLSDLPGPFRGDARARLLERLAALDAAMLTAARTQTDAATLQALRREAAEELAPFRDRMAQDVYDHAVESVVDRLLRERVQLPVIAFE